MKIIYLPQKSNSECPTTTLLWASGVEKAFLHQMIASKDDDEEEKGRRSTDGEQAAQGLRACDGIVWIICGR